MVKFILKITIRFLRLLPLCALPFIFTLAHAVPAFKPDPVLSQTSIEILNQLKISHYRYLSIDNEFSSKLFDRYLTELDPQRIYLLQSDIDRFEKHRYSFDNALSKGDLKIPFELFSYFQQQVEKRLSGMVAALEQGIDDIDFDIDESLETDRSDTSWARDEAELDDLWRKRLKSAILNLRLTEKPADEIQELLIKRYNNQLKRLNQTRIEDAFQIYMNVVAQSYDPHTEYFAPRRSENFNINMSLSLEGIGAVLQSDQEYTKIVRLVPGGPADLTKQLRRRDRIIGVAQEDGEMVDVIGWRLDEVVDLIRGKKGSTVRLEIIPENAESDDQTREVAIVRNRVQLEEQAAQKRIIEVGPEDDRSRFGVVEIPTFYADFEAYQAGDPNYKSTTRDVRKLLKELVAEGVDGVIVDLRNNGGGSLNEANALTGLFIKTGATVQVRNAQGRVKIFTDSDPEIAYDGPLAVLVNRLSASASEIFAGAIQDYQRGIVIGGQTFGKGTVQTLLPVQKGQLKITQAKFYRISGESTQHQGIIPDVMLPPMFDLTEIGEDSLEEALLWDTIRPVLHKKAGTVSPYIAELEERHTARIATEPDYQYRLAQIKRAEKNRSRTHISLNEKTRLDEQEESKATLLAIENERRLAKGEKLVKDIKELESSEEEEDAVAEAEEAEAPEEPDAYMVEGGNILADYIRLTNNQVAKK